MALDAPHPKTLLAFPRFLILIAFEENWAKIYATYRSSIFGSNILQLRLESLAEIRFAEGEPARRGGAPAGSTVKSLDLSCTNVGNHIEASGAAALADAPLTPAPNSSVLTHLEA